MPRVIWTPAALHDVKRLYQFLASKDVNAARRAAKTIRSGVKVLSQQPHIGRPIDDMPLEFREWLIDFGSSGYNVLYRFDNNEASILAVRHQREIDY